MKKAIQFATIGLLAALLLFFSGIIQMEEQRGLRAFAIVCPLFVACGFWLGWSRR